MGGNVFCGAFLKKTSYHRFILLPSNGSKQQQQQQQQHQQQHQQD
jgi:hypothetical protein